MLSDNTTPRPSTPDLPYPTFGLSDSHKRPRAYLTVARGGTLCSLSIHGYQPFPHVASTRGPITEFSRRSRRRAFRVFAELDRDALDCRPLFLTLTYPEAYPDQIPEAKRHLAAFWKRLRRRFSWVSAFWRIELQERGAPHFHLLIFGLSFLTRQWVAQNWAEVVGSGDPRHLNAGTEIRASLSWRLAANYLAKYIAKPTPDGQNAAIGRHWGILSRADFPRHPMTYLITWPLFDTIREQLISIITGGHPEDWPGNNYSGVWANLPGYRPPPEHSIPIPT